MYDRDLSRVRAIYLPGMFCCRAYLIIRFHLLTREAGAVYWACGVKVHGRQVGFPRPPDGSVSKSSVGSQRVREMEFDSLRLQPIAADMGWKV